MVVVVHSLGRSHNLVGRIFPTSKNIIGIIDIEKDPPASLSVSAIALSPISGYQLIDMSILTGVFALLSCPGCHRIQFLDFKKLMKNCLACLFI